MGFLDDAKEKLGELKAEHADTVEKVSDQAIDKVGDVVDEKTGGKYADQVDTAQQKADDAI